MESTSSFSSTANSHRFPLPTGPADADAPAAVDSSKPAAAACEPEGSTVRSRQVTVAPQSLVTFHVPRTDTKHAHAQTSRSLSTYAVELDVSPARAGAGRRGRFCGLTAGHVAPTSVSAAHRGSPLSSLDPNATACQLALGRAFKVIQDLRTSVVTDGHIARLTTAQKDARAELQKAAAAGADTRGLADQLETVTDWLDFACQCATSSAFSIDRIRASEISQTKAAIAWLRQLAEGMPGSAAAKPLNAQIDIFLARLGELQKQPSNTATKVVHDPVARAQHTSSFTIGFLRLFSSERADKAATKQAAKDLHQDATKDIQSQLLQALRDAHAADSKQPALRRVSKLAQLLGRDETFVEKQMKHAMGHELNTRESPPSFRSKVLLPLPLKAGETTPGHAIAVCTQTEGRALTDALDDAYKADGDGGQRANCHHVGSKHARSLFHSKMELDGQTALSLIRHGALSASAFTVEGVKKMSAQELGAAVHALAPNRYRLDSEQLGLHVKGWINSSSGLEFLSQLRAEANGIAAREVASAAVGTMRGAALKDIHSQAEEGNIPTVRLASVSALTPDGFRSGMNNNERRMWTDQAAAWAALSKEPVEMDVPEIDERGDIVKDADGRVKTKSIKVKFEVAAFNFPVNEFATKRISTFDRVSGVDFVQADNDAAMALMLGERFRDGLDDPDSWTPGGWMGDALANDDDTARREQYRKLAQQAAKMYVDRDYVGSDRDPYAMAKRVVALGNYSALAAANCKSGKDRTTELETQSRELVFALAKNLPTAFELHKPIKDPTERKSLWKRVLALGKASAPKAREDRTKGERLWHLHQAGGGREVQDIVAGKAGTKLKHKGVFARYGFNAQGANSLAMKTAYQGASSLVSS